MMFNTNISLREVDEFIISRFDFDPYEANFQEMRARHPHFKKGWWSPFTSPHRFLNRIIYKYIVENVPKSYKILDYGSYDGMLVKVLSDAGFAVRGVESLPWDEMYKFLGIDGLISYDFGRESEVDIVVCLNYAHRFKAEEFVKHIDMIAKPSIIFFDRCPTNPPCTDNGYFNDSLIKDLGFKVFKFPNCAVSHDSVAELMVYVR